MKILFLLAALIGIALADPSVLKAFGRPLAAEKIDDNASLHHYRLSDGRTVTFDDTVIVKLDDPQRLGALKARYRFTSVQRLSSRLYLLRFPAQSDILALCRALERENGVAFAQPNLRTKKRAR